MCVVSMVMDHYRERWTPYVPSVSPQIVPYPATGIGGTITVVQQSPITPDEIAEFRRLLDRAREYDKRHAEPECEMEEKKAALRAIAEKLGVDISFIDKQQYEATA